MLTVGYGDITPKNVYEKLFVIIAMFFSCGVFSYSFNLIGVIVYDMQKKKNEFKKEMTLVNRYLEKK
jgi:hypothetical protein